jgi:predicted cupin superfamily sugar epimerase
MHAEYWIEKLNLQIHPEGGYFRETYRAEGLIQNASLPASFIGERNYATAIYFLLTSANFSAFHKVASDEMWHFYTGSALEIHWIDTQAELQTIRLGSNFEKGEVFQALVPANAWFCAQVIDNQGYTLVGCTVAPGFNFADFELAKREDLIAQYPHLQDIIVKFTRQ